MGKMMEYKGYHASVEFDPDDNIFVGEVFGIADMLSFHGSSVVELKQTFEQSIDNYLELCATIGKEPEKEFKGTFNVRITPELHKKAALEAQKNNISLNQYVQNCIEHSFEEDSHTKIEKVIYIPYPEKTVSFKHTRFSNNDSYFDVELELPRRENIAYAEGLS